MLEFMIYLLASGELERVAHQRRPVTYPRTALCCEGGERLSSTRAQSFRTPCNTSSAQLRHFTTVIAQGTCCPYDLRAQTASRELTPARASN